MDKQLFEGGGGLSLLGVLSGVPDPRSAHGRRHPLGAVLALSVCAMLCGARSIYAIAQWGRDQGAPIARELGFTRDRTPCAATLHGLFKRLDKERFERAVGGWLQEQVLEPGEALAVDGKTLRGIHGEQLPGVHLLAAYAHETGIVVAQQAVGNKRNELSALPGLLDQLGLQGRVITADAQFTQREVSQAIVRKGGTTC